MRIWLDDERPSPIGWTLARTAQHAIQLLDNSPVELISLDHDLGDKEHDPEETGYTVICHIESKVVWDNEYVAPRIRIHTANGPARMRMEMARASIKRLMRVKGGIKP